MDKRIKKLAKNLVTYACDVQAGEKVLISYEGVATRPLIKTLVKDIYRAGGVPFVEARDSSIMREILLGTEQQQLEFMRDIQLAQMKGMDAYIAISGDDNITELSDVPAEKLSLYSKVLDPVLRQRVDHTKWVLLRYPNSSMAQLAGMSLEGFENLYFDVCNLDYSKMSLAMDALVALMNRTDKVHITGPGTNLTFSIKGISAIKCDGKMNIPDGEVYTAPVRESMNGRVSYNAPSTEQGFKYENVAFEVKNGKIIKATANNNERINQLLDTDDGARYFGEFSFGLNPYILQPMNDILFDEKIAGSFHLTPGACYEDASNGNKSAVHWDLVCVQRPEYGGGEIYLDDVLVRKNGLFVLPELECLNPENLQ
ncbi:MAG: aminopeptidase [Candidatus Nomurabacteria bacterium]|jgi:aminopeptidase|nr:aminopeptidase [Candidatus Nomurabacteria bacterium]